MAFAALVVAGCGSDQVFSCNDDVQCESVGIAGTCEANGFCSFPDPACDSGRRYGSYAGGGLEGSCVPEPMQTTGDSTTTTTDGSSSTQPPMTSLGDDESSSGGSPMTTGSSGEPGECPGVCSLPAPAGWSGPIVLGDAGECADVLWTAGSVPAPSAACACCSDVTAQGLSCDARVFQTVACTDGGTPLGYAEDCAPFVIGSLTGQTRIVPGGDGGGTCAASSPLEAGVAVEATGCGLSLLGSCEDGSGCFDAAPDSQVCVWRPGEFDCPDATQDRRVLYRGADGAYDCGCSCSASQACDQLELFESEGCKDEAVVLEAADGCVPPDAFKSGELWARASAGCVDDGTSRNLPEPLGGQLEPTVADPVTVCCGG